MRFGQTCRLSRRLRRVGGALRASSFLFREWYGSRWFRYVECCRALVESEDGAAEVARDDLWAHIDRLSADNIIDVRIGVARLLGVICGMLLRTSPLFLLY